MTNPVVHPGRKHARPLPGSQFSTRPSRPTVETLDEYIAQHGTAGIQFPPRGYYIRGGELVLQTFRDEPYWAAEEAMGRSVPAYALPRNPSRGFRQ